MSAATPNDRFLSLEKKDYNNYILSFLSGGSEREGSRLLSRDDTNALLKDLRDIIGGHDTHSRYVTVTEEIDGTIKLSFLPTHLVHSKLTLYISHSDAEKLFAELSRAIDGI
jgi:hypothetical protein